LQEDGTTSQEEMDKLHRLLIHWVEHNQSHEQQYSDWARRAKDLGHHEVGDPILEAVDHMKEVDKLLMVAHRGLL
jgi:hypothetical protein